MSKLYYYQVGLTWTGNLGQGTSSYKEYSRDYNIENPQKPTIEGSSDPAFLGKQARWNPEELFISSLSSCHQLWYLHLCADVNVCVLSYQDIALGVMDAGSGKFVEVTLQPIVTISNDSDDLLAKELHMLAHKKCYIANSINFPVHFNIKIIRFDPI